LGVRRSGGISSSKGVSRLGYRSPCFEGKGIEGKEETRAAIMNIKTRASKQRLRKGWQDKKRYQVLVPRSSIVMVLPGIVIHSSSAARGPRHTSARSIVCLASVPSTKSAPNLDPFSSSARKKKRKENTIL
jgi:hypothetical protein